MADSDTIKLVDAQSTGPVFRRTRLLQDVSIARVHQRLDLSKPSIHRFEKGDHDIRLSCLLDLADLLGYEVILQVKNP